MATRGSGGADGLMLRVDASRFKPRRGRRLLIWLTFAAMLVAGILLGLVMPRTSTTIELGSGSSFNGSADGSAPLFAASEYHHTHTTLWLLNADHPGRPGAKIADIPHAFGWDIEAAVAPDSRVVAALAIPPGRSDPASEAALFLINKSGVKRIAEGLDLRGGIVWSDEGQQVIVRRGRTIAVVETGSGREIAAWTAAGSGEAFPLAMRGDNLWIASLESSGSFVTQLRLKDEQLALLDRYRISGRMSRDWQLSADRTLVAFTELHGLDLQVRVKPLAHEADRWISSSWSEDLEVATAHRGPFEQSASPVWRPDGRLDLGSWADAGGVFTLPLAWHPNGQWLAQRSLTGTGPVNVSAERLALGTPDGQVFLAAAGFAFVGWWPA